MSTDMPTNMPTNMMHCPTCFAYMNKFSTDSNYRDPVDNDIVLCCYCGDTLMIKNRALVPVDPDILVKINFVELQEARRVIKYGRDNNLIPYPRFKEH